MLGSVSRGASRSAAGFLSLVLVAWASGGCRRETPAANESGLSAKKPVTLILGGYTTPREVYGKAILPAFQKEWQGTSGQRVQFRESYQGSSAQARAIVGGFEADVAVLSLEGDIDKIAQAGLITHDWKAAPHGGMVSTSIVVLAVRPGNPKKILDWPDLTRPGLNVLTPDPKTSGGAQWNINAMYGAALKGFAGVRKDDRAAAKDFLKRVFRNVSIMDKGARESITTFEKGVGDVAITYENEILIGRQAGQKYDYVVPRSTILIENPVALVDRYADQHTTPAGYLPLIALSAKWEQNFAESIVGTGDERSLAMQPSRLSEFITSVRERFEDAARQGEAPVLVTSPNIRPFVRGIVERFRSQTSVLSQSEIHPRVRLKTVGSI